MCLFRPDLMAGGRIEPTAEASNRPQIPCSPPWKMEVNGRENDILLSDRSWPQSSSRSQRNLNKNFRENSGSVWSWALLWRTLETLISLIYKSLITTQLPSPSTVENSEIWLKAWQDATWVWKEICLENLVFKVKNANTVHKLVEVWLPRQHEV